MFTPCCMKFSLIQTHKELYAYLSYSWQVRTLIRVYNTIETLRKVKALSVICSSYRLRIQKVISGVVAWIYSSLRKAERDPLGADLIQRWFYVTGAPGVINQSCARAQEQLDYLKDFDDALLKGYREDPFQQLDEVLHSAGYTHWLLYWSLTLAYTFQNAPIPHLADFIMSQKEATKRLWRRSRAPARGRNNAAESMVHSFLTWFNALLSVSTYPTPENIDHEQSTRVELKYRWDAEKQRRRSLSRPTYLYTKVDELNDRMALLIGELRYHPSEGLAKALIKDVQESVLQRQGTTKIKSPRPTDLRITSHYVTIRIKDPRPQVGEVAHWSPWELTCTNYLINLRSHYNTLRGCVKLKEKQISATRMNATFNVGCRPFIQRGYSMVASWDENLPCTLSDWWCTETESLFATTLLDELKLHALDMHHYRDSQGYIPASYRSKVSEESSSRDSTDSSDNGNSQDSELKNESYPVKFLDDKLFGDKIRIILHNTMLQNMPLMAQEYMFDAMVELERKLCLPCTMTQAKQHFPHLLPLFDPGNINSSRLRPPTAEAQLNSTTPSPAPSLNTSQVPMSTNVKSPQHSMTQTGVENYFVTPTFLTQNTHNNLTPEELLMSSSQDNSASGSTKTEAAQVHSAADVLASEPEDQPMDKNNEPTPTQSSECSIRAEGIDVVHTDQPGVTPSEPHQPTYPEHPKILPTQKPSVIRIKVSCPHKKGVTPRGPSETVDGGIFPNLCKLLVQHPEYRVTYRNDSGTALLKWDGNILSIEASTAVLPSYPNETGDEYQPHTGQYQDQNSHTGSIERGALHGTAVGTWAADDGSNSGIRQPTEPLPIETENELEPTVRFNPYDEVLLQRSSPTLTNSTAEERRPLQSPPSTTSPNSHDTERDKNSPTVDQHAWPPGLSADPIPENGSVDFDNDGSKYHQLPSSSQAFHSSELSEGSQLYPSIACNPIRNSTTQDQPEKSITTLDTDRLGTVASTLLPNSPSRSTFCSDLLPDADDQQPQQQFPPSLSVDTSAVPAASEPPSSSVLFEPTMLQSDTDTKSYPVGVNTSQAEFLTPSLPLQPVSLPPILPAGIEPPVLASPPYPDDGNEPDVSSPYHNVTTSKYAYHSASVHTLFSPDGERDDMDGYSQESSGSNNSSRAQRSTTRITRDESVTSILPGSRFRDSSPVNTDPDIHLPRRRNSIRSVYDALLSASDDSDTAEYVTDDYDDRQRIPAPLPETRPEITIFSESEFNYSDKDDYKDVFKTTSTIFHPHYMVTSIEGVLSRVTFSCHWVANSQWCRHT
jgi:hypothetical protein